MADQYIQEVANSLGNIPFVYYGTYQIDVRHIDYFNLYYENGIPSFRLVFYDTLNLMTNKAFPLDDTKIKVFLHPRSDQLKEILIQFKIRKFEVNEGKYNIDGILDNNLLHVEQFKSYSNMTSHKALQQVCKNCGLGFNTNIDDTNDAMTWINGGDVVSNFIMYVVDHSYKSDQSFITTFVDYYYNLNMIDIEKELTRNTDNDMSVTDNVLLSSLNSSGSKEQLVSLLFSNDESFKETNMFFDTYRIINHSTEVSLRSGYKNLIKFYDELNKSFLIFDLDSITSKGDKTIILKGNPQDNEFFNLNTRTRYLGKTDFDNCHKNYNYAQQINEKNITDLEKIGIEISMVTPNYSIYKFQKIKLFISNQTATPSTGLKNDRLSGEWLIIDIRLVYSNQTFKQIINLVKRELELSDDELSNEKH
jgi:hypothetical protein